MEFNVDLINALAKRGWKIIVWVLPINIFISSYLLFFIIIEKGLYTINKISEVDGNIISLLSFLVQNILLSFIIILIFYIIKGDSGDKIKKIRSKFYKYSKERIFNLFIYRYSPPHELDKDILELVGYHNLYEKNGVEHTINAKRLTYSNLVEIDSLYIVYKVNENEKVLFSVWHTGNKVSIAIAFDKKNMISSSSSNESEIFNSIVSRYKDILNISDAKDVSIQIREKYYWFDIVYEVTEELLINSMEQEDISRKMAHVVTVGLPIAMYFMGWKAK